MAEMSASRARRPNFRITDNLLRRPPSGDYELVLPKWTKTIDGKCAGVDMKSFSAAIEASLALT